MTKAKVIRMATRNRSQSERARLAAIDIMDFWCECRLMNEPVFTSDLQALIMRRVFGRGLPRG